MWSNIPLIPRTDFFGNPDRAGVKLSPDARYISYLAAYNGVLNVYVAPVDYLASARVVTNDTKRGIRSYFWSYDNRHIIYAQDKDGDENWHLYILDIDNPDPNTAKDITPFEGARVQVLAHYPTFNSNPKYDADRLLILCNNRRADYFDVYSYSINDQDLYLKFLNDTYIGFIADFEGQIRFGIREEENGGRVIDGLFCGSKDNSYIQEGMPDFTAKPFMVIEPEDVNTTGIVGFNSEGDILYIQDSRGRNTAALFAYDFSAKMPSRAEPSQGYELLYVSEHADVHDVMLSPIDWRVQAVSCNYLKESWHFLNQQIAKIYQSMANIDIGTPRNDRVLHIISRSADDETWIVGYKSPHGPMLYYKKHRDQNSIDYLFCERDALNGDTLCPMYPVIIKTGDRFHGHAIDMVSYLTLPKTVKAAISDMGPEAGYSIQSSTPVSMILLVHGGPTARDSWEYSGMHQWLANRGYAVLSVNYRGSSGFGKAFLNAGNGEWAAKMHDDLITAINWAVNHGICTKEQVAIFGGSYGGYATLVGLTMTPDVFACGIDLVGPSNLETLMKSIPEYWKPIVESWKLKIGGDPNTAEGRAFLHERSPLHRASAVKKPLLVVHGANDPRVKVAEAEQIVDALARNKIPVVYLLYPDEGHGLARPGNFISFTAVVENFLGGILGGRVQEVGDDLKNTSLEVKHGLEYLPPEIRKSL